MKERIASSIQQLFADRALLLVSLLFLVGCTGLIISLALSIHPSDLQIVVHYTSFGNTNFYRDKWYYLLGFILFVLLMAVVHMVLVCKILAQKGRDLAIAFAWLSVVLVFIAAVTFYQVLKIASLT